MKNENYAHFEEYAARCCHDHSLEEIVGAYVGSFPGRVTLLIPELVRIAREWDNTQEQVDTIQQLNDVANDETED